MLMGRAVKIVVVLFTAMIALQALGVPIALLVAGISVAGGGIGLALLRQIHLTVDVAYKTDLDRALAIVRDVVATHPQVLKDPAPSVGISSLGHPAVTIAVEPWTAVAQFNATQGELNKAILERLRDAQIEFPPLSLSHAR